MLPIKSSTKYVKSTHVFRLLSNTCANFIRNRQRDDDVILPERQFNCPPCEQLKKSTCQIPSWVKPPCDGR